MSTNTKAQFIRPPHSLRKAVVGDGPARMDPTLLQKAEAVVEEMEENFPTWADEYLDQMREALDEAQSDPEAMQDQIQRIFTLVMDLKGQAGSYGYQMLTELGDLLKKYTEDLTQIDQRDSQIIEAHIDAIRLVFTQKVRGHGGDVGAALLKDIERAVKKYGEARQSVPAS